MILLNQARFTASIVNFIQSNLIARDIDKSRTRFLQRNQIYCIKKPVQSY